MSFNLRYGTAEDGVNIWDNRRELALAHIQSFAPDLLGVQECQDNFQAEFLKENLPDYGFVGVPRGGMKLVPEHVRLEMTAVFYRGSVFELLEAETFWLSKTPEKPGSQSWGSMFARTVTWVRLKPSQCPHVEIFFFNTHFDHFSQKAIRESAKLLSERIAALTGNMPVILTGDFNTLKDTPAYKTLTDAGLRDVYRESHPQEEVSEGTFHGFGRVPPLAIDWILVSRHFEVIKAGVDRFHGGNIYASDHYPITAVLSFAPKDHEGSS